MKIILKVLKYLALLLLLVVIGFFVDRHFISYYKVEEAPKYLEIYNAWIDAVFKSKKIISRAEFLEKSGVICYEAENVLMRELGYIDGKNPKGDELPNFSLTALLIRMTAEDLKADFSGEASVMSAPFFAKNSSLAVFSERTYESAVLAQYRPQFETGKRIYADFPANSVYLSYNPITKKIDFPMAVNGVSLWQKCGFTDNGKIVSIAPSAKARLEERIKQELSRK